MSHPTATDYARAEQMLAPYRARRIPRVEPRWMRAGERFGYRVGAEYVVVDPGSGRRQPAFDHNRLAAALSVASSRAVAATDLPITAVDPDDTGKVRFFAFGSWWEWNDRTGTCWQTTEAPPAPGEVVSPDGAWAAFRKDGDTTRRRRQRCRTSTP
jgi:dipeptidyl-peptidase-4